MTEKTHKVTSTDLQRFMLAVDNYSTVSAHRQKHQAGRFSDVVRQYAKMTGTTQKEAKDILFELIP